MKLALVNLNMTVPDPPLGLAYLAAYLKKYSDISDIVIIDKEDKIKGIKREKPDIIGIGAMTYEFPEAKLLAEEIKKKFDIPIILGGHHITLMPNHFLNPPFDVVVLGEGERTLVELMQIFERNGSFPIKELRNTKGIIFRNDRNANEMTPTRPLIEPLDEIPYPARDLLKMKEYYLTLRKTVFGKLGIYGQMITSRGCPYKCTFCSTTLFWRRPRFHSAEYVVGEMKHLIERYDVDVILIFDDLFIANKKRIAEIAELMEKEGINEKIKLYVFGRTSLIDIELLKNLKRMNVVMMEFGLESGSEKVLAYLKKGQVTVEENRKALELCKKFGIRTNGSLIIGSPEETEEDLKQTLSLLKDKNLDVAHVCQLTPYPGTEVWEYAKKMGIVSDDPNFDLKKIYLLEFKPDLIMTKYISKEEFERWYYLLRTESEKKLHKVSLNELFSEIKPKHLKYILTSRFLKKIIFDWKETVRYAKQTKIK
jgi:radical SAM superfamily enzyme YgiQ (UPF0313 family)